MENNWWRLTGAEPRFLGLVDSRAALFFPPILFYLRVETIVLFLVVLAILGFLERRGYTVAVATRMLRLWCFFTLCKITRRRPVIRKRNSLYAYRDACVGIGLVGNKPGAAK